MKELLKYLWERRTTVLGYVQVILGVWIVADNVFSPEIIKMFVLINGTVTAVLGHYNNSQVKADKATAEKEEQ